MIYELREYISQPGAEKKVHDRFAGVTLTLFERHGLEVAGFWVDEADPQRILYLLAFENAEAQECAWSRFQNDPEWKSAKSVSEADGPIVAEMISRTLRPVDYWPVTTDRERTER
ncbi:NIPSNAP family protein [Aeromicrobium piscarium]|nr:NIPSNAP family protein [Aeromicrobium piscarium]